MTEDNELCARDICGHTDAEHDAIADGLSNETELIREAAKQMRLDFPGTARSGFGAAFRATADLLDRVADDWTIASYGYWSTCAVAIAEGYLDPISSPEGSGG